MFEFLFAALIGSLIGGVAVVIIALLTWNYVSTWIRNNTIKRSSFTKLIKEKLRNGNYKVVAGVFDNRGVHISKTEWEAETLDDELLSKFYGSNTIKIKI